MFTCFSRFDEICLIRGFKESDLIVGYITNSEENMLHVNTTLVSTFLWAVSLEHYILHLHALYGHCVIVWNHIYDCICPQVYTSRMRFSPLWDTQDLLPVFLSTATEADQRVSQYFTHPSFILMIELIDYDDSKSSCFFFNRLW